MRTLDTALKSYESVLSNSVVFRAVEGFVRPGSKHKLTERQNEPDI
jgi:hypothetical protein